MKTANPFIKAVLLGAGLLALSATASAHDRYERYDRHDRYERHHHYDRYYGRDVRVIERRYYEPVYERRAPIYRAEPGVTVRIGLPLPPPIFIPFH